MAWLKMAAGRLLALFRRKRLEESLDEELRGHLGMLVKENIRRGMPPEEARVLRPRRSENWGKASPHYMLTRGALRRKLSES